jgi:dipeptidase E
VPNPDKLFGLIGKAPEDTTGAIITNAKEKRTAEEKELKLRSLQADLATIGLSNTVELDLRRGIPPLRQYDYLYAAGGNAFDLRRAMVETEFDGELRDYLEQGGVYVGESAGAIVVGPSLRGFQMDNHRSDNPIWTGMGLIKTVVVPHNDSPDPAYRNRAGHIQRSNPNYRALPLGDNNDFIINK